MQLSDALKRLPHDALLDTLLHDPECDVYTVSFLTEQPPATLRSDVLYVGDSSLLPESFPASMMFNCILLGAAKLDEQLAARDNTNLVLLSPTVDPYQCFNALQNAFLEDQELTAIVGRMLAAHFSNRGLQYLVEEAATALGHPIVVVDPTYRYVAYHLGELSEQECRLSHILREEIASETLMDQAIAYIRDERIDSQIAHSKGPFEQHNEILGCNTMTLAVMVSGLCIAHVMMMEHGRPFGEIDREAFERLACFVAQEMQKSELWGPTSGELGSYFLHNLISDRHPSEAVTRRRLKALNFHPKPVLYLVCLHAEGSGLERDQVERLAGQLRPVLHHALYTSYHRQFVALLSRDEDDPLSERSEPKLQEVATLNSLSVGVSNAFTSITETRSAYEQARSAIRYGTLTSNALNDNGLYHYADIAYLRMLEFANRRTNLMNFCHPALLRLQAHDEEHKGELMDTLFFYLQFAGSTTRAAKLLCLHKNTMLYRMGRIRELLGVDLSSGEVVFALQVSFRVLMYLGLYVPKVKTTRAELGSA